LAGSVGGEERRTRKRNLLPFFSELLFQELEGSYTLTKHKDSREHGAESQEHAADLRKKRNDGMMEEWKNPIQT
jgi:hypothetical protein